MDERNTYVSLGVFMSIKIKTNMLDVLDELDLILDKKTKQAVYKGLKRALGRTAISFRKQVVKEIQKEVKLPTTYLKEDFVKINRAGLKKRSIMGLYIAVDVHNTSRSQGVSLIRFIAGKKEPRKQTGKRVNRRTKLRAQVTPGKRTTLKKAFIAKVTASDNSSHYHVFVRDKRGRLIKQTVPRPHVFAKRKRVTARILKAMLPVLVERVKHEIQWYLKSIRNKGS